MPTIDRTDSEFIYILTPESVDESIDRDNEDARRESHEVMDQFLRILLAEDNTIYV